MAEQTRNEQTRNEQTQNERTLDEQQRNTDGDGTAPCRMLAVTGTDTEIGKTVVTMSLAIRARALGLRVAAMKPIESGISARAPMRFDAGALAVTEHGILSDAERLARAAGAEDDLDVVGPIVLSEPLAPMMAASRAGVTIDFEKLDRARETLAQQRDLLLIEGAGGILAPIRRDYSFATLFKRWGADIVIVAGNRLGVLNHTLLTVRVAEAEGLTVKAVVLTDISDKDPSIAEATNYDALVALLPRYPIHRFPWIDRLDDSSALSAAVAGAGLDSVLLPAA